jgi:O-acetyl-ADP-ribose deacetylase (regulator of RNase III)
MTVSPDIVSRLELERGDITKMTVDAIVNAANTTLLGGGGVDGAIHRAAGPELLAECRSLGGCPTGEARLTKGYRLPAKYVIHTVGPVWHGGTRNEDRLLAGCYAASLRLAAGNRCRSIAFPNISTGIYGFPKKQAATIAIQEVVRFLTTDKTIRRVVFVCFDEENFLIYSKQPPFSTL